VSILLAVVVQALSMAPLPGASVVGAYALGVALPKVGVTLATGHGYETLTGETPLAHGTLT
jgi:cytochrome c biogenesis protein CcdA